MPEATLKREQVVKILGTVLQRATKAPAFDDTLLNELHQLKSAIDEMHEALNYAHPDGIQSHIPNATDELDAIVATTEAATNSIMEACENIQGFIKNKPTSESSAIEGEITRILEACTFQDITGQRITKIIKALKAIDQHASELNKILSSRFGDLENKEEDKQSSETSLMNGPQMPDQAISQEEIDKLLNDLEWG